MNTIEENFVKKVCSYCKISKPFTYEFYGLSLSDLYCGYTHCKFCKEFIKDVLCNNQEFCSKECYSFSKKD